MNMKLKRFFGVLLSLALVMGLMPVMSLTAYAETYTTNQNLSTLALNDILDTTVESITLTNDKDKKAFYAIADTAPTSNDGYTPVEQNGFFSLPIGLKYKVIEVAEIASGVTNDGWYYTFAEVKYPLWLGGVQVKSGNASNIAGDNTASYDSATNTLSLNNYIYDGVGYKQSLDLNPTADGIFYSGTGTETLKINLTGQNKVKCSTEDSIVYGYGIRVEDTAVLEIIGNGSLVVSSTNANHPYGLKVNSLTVAEGTSVSVTAGNTNSGKSTGIKANGIIEVNGTLEVQAGEATGNDGSPASYGINNEGSDKIIIGTKGKLTAKSGKGYYDSYGILTRGPIEVNGTLNAEGGETVYTGNDFSHGNSYGVLCTDSFLSNGKVTAKGGKGSVSSVGINVVEDDGTLTVTSGTLSVEGGASNTSVGIMAMKTISFMDGVVNASEKSVGDMGVGIYAGKFIDIGEKTFFVSTGKTNAIMVSGGTISSQINGKGWDNTQGTGNGSLITASDNLVVSDYNKVQFPETKPAATVETAPAEKSGLIYTGSAQELITPGEKGEGAKEMQYVLGKDATTAPTEGWSTSIPKATDAGTYYVWYKAVGDNAHSDSEAKVITVTIKKKGEAHTHTFKLVDAKEPTCTEDGYKEHYECTECGAWFQDRTGVSEIIDKSGYTIGAIGHKWGAYEVTKRPTYDEEGLKVYTCENDPSHTKEETIPRLSSSSDSDSDSDYDSDSSGRRSSSGSSTKNTASQAMVDEINNVTSGNVPENHQAESGLPASDVGGNWGNNAEIWTYTKSDGTVAKAEWMNLDYNGLRYWYYFDSNGIMQTNWFDYNNERFYLMPEKDGWRGRMATGWKNIENKWYYFETVPGSSQGRLYRSTVTPDGHTVGADGAWNGVGATPVGQK